MTYMKEDQLYDKIEKIVQSDSIEFVRFEQADLHGVSRSKTVPVEMFREYVKEGLSFGGPLLAFDIQSTIAECTGYGHEIAFGDQMVRADLGTFMTIPWVPNTARVIVDNYWYGDVPAMASPRLVLKKILEEYRELGFICRIGYEFEFYVLDRETKKPVYEGQPLWVTLKNNWDTDFMYYLMRKMREAGIQILTQHSEAGPGQQEINLCYRDGLQAADEAFTFKHGVKEIAYRHNYLATFMTKPFINTAASGSHLHVSLIDIKSGRNIFHDPESKYELSELCLNFVGGILKHARSANVFNAPTINCHKRYRVNSLAPHSATWGLENRTVGIRIKGVRGESTHIENRLGCGGSNPYLLAISTLATGLIGIKNKLQPSDPIADVAYTRNDIDILPSSLEECLQFFKEDAELHEILGSEFVKLFVAVKEFEINKAKQHISDYGTSKFNDRIDTWEINEYMELL